MSFDALIARVEQAERALEAHERRTAADFRQWKSSWREAWTPGRILLAGAISGFLVGRAQPLRAVGGGGAMQLLSALAGLFASSNAQAAVEETEQTTQQSEETLAAADATGDTTGQAA